MIKYVEEPEGFLVDSGLLFRINQQVLHPLGLALEMKFDDDGKGIGFGIWEGRDDPEGWIFSPDTFKDGQRKFEKYMAEHGDAALESRLKALGFWVQCCPDMDACADCKGKK